MEPVKFDTDKAKLHLISPSLINGLGEVLTFGAKKYAERNWEGGMPYSRYFGALNRHIWTWWDGEDLDPETKLSHLKHAAACIMFLIETEKRIQTNTLDSIFDDRPHNAVKEKRL
jgi:hypothetical protein